VPDVKSNRSRSGRPQIQLGIGKIAAPLPQVFIRQLQGVQDGTSNCGNFGLTTAQPRFDWGHEISETLFR
jgi:hypothetical protein